MGALMNGAVIYKSKYGATQQYAEWIGKELKIPVLSPERLDGPVASACDFLVIGTSIYTGKLLIKDCLREHRELLRTKKVLLFVVCGSAASDPEAQRQILKNVLSEDLLLPADVFFLPGRLRMQDLSLADKLILKLGARLEEDPVKKQAMSQNIDAVKKEHIDKVIDAVRRLFSAQLPI